jgi:hypothetical protein
VKKEQGWQMSKRLKSWIIEFSVIIRTWGPKNATTAITLLQVHIAAIQEMRWTGKTVMEKGHVIRIL